MTPLTPLTELLLLPFPFFRDRGKGAQIARAVSSYTRKTLAARITLCRVSEVWVPTEEPGAAAGEWGDLEEDREDYFLTDSGAPSRTNPLRGRRADREEAEEKTDGHLEEVSEMRSVVAAFARGPTTNLLHFATGSSRGFDRSVSDRGQGGPGWFERSHSTVDDANGGAISPR